MVHGADGHEGRDMHALLAHGAVRQDEEGEALRHSLGRLLAQPHDVLAKRIDALGAWDGRVEHL